VIYAATTSSNSITGALIAWNLVVGITGNINIGGNVKITSNIDISGG
jgi:hypothetical protein